MIEAALIEKAKKAIIAHDQATAEEVARQVIDSGTDPMALMNEAFIPAIGEVGDMFGRGQMFLPELVQSADVMKQVTAIVNDALPADAEREKQGVVVIATVKGDVHDIGKGIVVALLKANGLEVHDAGRDVETEKIIDLAEKVGADVIGTSALLTTTMSRQKEVEQMLKKSGLRDKYRTVVGGAPVTARWASKIGADAYAEDAQDSVIKIKELIRG